MAVAVGLRYALNPILGHELPFTPLLGAVALRPMNCVGDSILCTAHGYRMNIETGYCYNEPDLKLVTYPTLVENGEVWVKTKAS